MSCTTVPYSPPAVTREGDLLTCHKCGKQFPEWEGPRCNNWAPRSLASCMTCLEEFHETAWNGVPV